jgi:hypothetical protein
MQEEQTTGAAHGRETCGDLGDQLAEMIGLRPDTREHLRNARIEVLKAVRSVIDSKIDRLSQAGQKGTKLSVD